MKRRELGVRILMLSIVMALLCGATGCYCAFPWWGDEGRHGGGGGGGHHESNGGPHHGGGDRD